MNSEAAERLVNAAKAAAIFLAGHGMCCLSIPGAKGHAANLRDAIEAVQFGEDERIVAGLIDNGLRYVDAVNEEERTMAAARVTSAFICIRKTRR